MKEKPLYLLLGFLALLLWLPLLQGQLKIVNSGTLSGMVAADTTTTQFTPERWLDGSFQQAVNEKAQVNTGFRPDFIRLRNQLDYTLFRKVNAQVVVGRNNNLFEQAYIDAYFGRDFAGSEAIQERVRKLKYVQDTLDKLGKTLVFIYAPNKARFMPENLPRQAYDETRTGPTNYDVYKKYGEAAGLRQIDFNAWFRDAGRKTKHPVYGRPGIHWTEYGALLAADSFRNFMNALPHHRFVLPELIWNDAQEGVTSGPQGAEDDLGKLLNLIVPISDNTFFHPYLEVRTDDKQPKPAAIYIADSYMWMWRDIGIPQRLNSRYQFWSYFYDVWSSEWSGKKNIKDIDPMAEVMRSDWIVMLYTECNFARPGGDFPERAYAYFTGTK